ncbi:hypothetical protein ACROYT_G039525 [Oculina patagonica]
MDVFVDFNCEHEGETGRFKLTVHDIDTKNIRDVKLAIQDAIQAPVCDQKLFYQGQQLTDDTMPLCRLYFREGDCFELHFLAAADIEGMRKELNVLKITAQEIVENLQRQLPGFQPKENDHRGLLQFMSFFHPVQSALKKLTNNFFHPWKCFKSVAHRHFFVQEGGFDHFLEVFKFSRLLYSIRQGDGILREDRGIEICKWELNRSLLTLQHYCLHLLWSFSETPQDREFTLSKSVLPLAIDALLLPHPFTVEDYALNYPPLDSLVIKVNDAAIGCFGGLVEQDSNAQEVVSKTPQLIDKLLHMIHCASLSHQSESPRHSMFSSQLAAIILFYCTFNVKSAQSFVDCGALTKMIEITTNLLVDQEDHDTPLRYYCCLFLARMRSAPLVTLERDNCIAVDELIDMFLARHVPDEISQWEESLSFVWVTMVPLVHLAFAAGEEWKKRAHRTVWKSENVEGQSATNSTPSLESSTTLDAYIDRENSVASGRSEIKLKKNEKVFWPGSPATQKLGIFSLVHMLSIKDNRQLALTQNLVPYLVCLTWHLSSDKKEMLSAGLANFKSVSAPSLKIAAKSVLAFVNGLDMVLSL